MCRIFGVPMEALPQIRPSAGNFGEIGGVPVRAAMVDQQAALYGHGCRAAGDAKITFGTGAFALAVTGAKIIRAPEKGLLPTIAWAKDGARTYAVDGGVYDAGSAVEWAGRIGLFADMSELAAFEAAPAISRGLGLRACPLGPRQPALGPFGGGAVHWHGRGNHEAGHGAGGAGRHCPAHRRGGGGDERDAAHRGRISVDGGLTRSAYFVDFLAMVLEREIICPDFDELTAFGVASMAAGGEIARPGGHASSRQVRARPKPGARALPRRWRGPRAGADNRTRHPAAWAS